MPPRLTVNIRAIFRAEGASVLPDGSASGIVKTALAGPAPLDAVGLIGDYHADRSVHGGPDKALHHYPLEHYATLATHFPQAAERLLAGAMGENLSASGLDETQICIGDVFTLGGARIQVTQPRRPCWKIDQRFGVRGMAAWIQRSGGTGWYYRVLECAPIVAGDCLTLCERDPAAPTLAEFHRLVSAQRPDPERLSLLARLAALPPALAGRLRQRAAWLKHHG